MQAISKGTTSPVHVRPPLKGVRAVSSANPAVAVESSRLVRIGAARAFDEQDLRHDLAAFLLDGAGSAEVLELAAEMPRPGSRIHVLAEPVGQRPAAYPARVSDADERMIAFAFDDPSLDLTGTSGSALLDADGRVAGILLAGGLQDDTLRGFANPVTAIKSALTQALSN